MVKFYVRKIEEIGSVFTLEDVPKKYYEKVKNQLIEDGFLVEE